MNMIRRLAGASYAEKPAPLDAYEQHVKAKIRASTRQGVFALLVAAVGFGFGVYLCGATWGAVMAALAAVWIMFLVAAR